MRFSLFFLLLISSHFSMAQVRVFNEAAKELIEAKDSIVEIDTNEPSNEPYNYLSEGSEALNVLFMSETKSLSRARPDELAESRTLMSLARLATNAWKGTQYSDSKKWRALSKHFKRAFNKSTTKFNYTDEISFRIKLVNNHGKRYYYDKRVGLSDHNLYVGKKPKGLTKEEKEELPDPIPLSLFTEEELVELFVKQLKKENVIRDVRRGRYSCIGINVEIDERTLNRNRIPTARVVMIFGARRLREVRVKNPVKT